MIITMAEIETANRDRCPAAGIGKLLSGAYATSLGGKLPQVDSERDRREIQWLIDTMNKNGPMLQITCNPSTTAIVDIDIYWANGIELIMSGDAVDSERLIFYENGKYLVDPTLDLSLFPLLRHMAQLEASKQAMCAARAIDAVLAAHTF
jgi:hypothetical protein